MTAAEELARRLSARRVGGDWRTACPLHDDAHPSLDFRDGDSGALVFVCRSQRCDSGIITAHYRRLHPDLFPRREDRPRQATVCKTRRYEIRDAADALIAVHVREDRSDGKKRFRWEQPDGTHGLTGKPVADLPLYGADRLKGFPPDAAVTVVEGEKAADAILRLGLPALGTVTGAASSPSPAVLDALLRGRSLCLWPDADEPGRSHMNKLARALAGVASEVRFVEWGEPGSGADAADFVARGGTLEQLVALVKSARPWSQRTEAARQVDEALRKIGISGGDPYSPLRALPPNANVPEIISALREMRALLDGADPLELAGAREQAIQLLGDRLRSPARLVDAALSSSAEGASDARGGSISFDEPEPWPEPVPGADLLDELVSVAERYLILAPGAAQVIALWVLHAYAIDAFDSTGYLALTSPTKRCGKTTGLRIIKALCPRALSADNISPAAVFRTIEEHQPVLLIDELDRVHRDSDVWGILNSGHTRGGCVIRVEGEEREPQQFSTFAPKVLSYIRRAGRHAIPDTIEDRSIRIAMQRRAPGERREKLRTRTLTALAAPLRSKLARWAADNVEALRFAEPEVPEALDDRAADSWEPLLAVADAAGSHWPDRARALAVQFAGDRAEDEAEDPGQAVLADLRTLMDSGELSTDGGVSSEEACRLLRDLPERPWSRWGKAGDGMTPHALGRLLRPFDVRSQLTGSGSVRVRRLPVDALRKAFDRYITTSPPAASHEVLQALQPLQALGASTDGSTSGAHERLVALPERSERSLVDRTPAEELVLDLPVPDTSVYRHGGREYRAGDVLPDGRDVLSVDDGVPTLSKRPRGEL